MQTSKWIMTVGYVRGLKIGKLSVDCDGKRVIAAIIAAVDLSPYADELPLRQIEAPDDSSQC